MCNYNFFFHYFLAVEPALCWFPRCYTSASFQTPALTVIYPDVQMIPDNIDNLGWAAAPLGNNPAIKCCIIQSINPCDTFSVEFPFIITTHLVSSHIPTAVFYLVVAQPVRQRSRYEWYILVLVRHFLAAGLERQKLNFNGLLKPLYLIWGLPHSLAPNGCSLIQPQEISALLPFYKPTGSKNV